MTTRNAAPKTSERYPTAPGYMTERVRSQYIAKAVESGHLPEKAHRMPAIISLSAPEDPSTPIQFWQLYSVLGQDRIVALIRNFYQRVFGDETWFRSVFERVGGLGHHINTQAGMWIDAMGGGLAYHGGEYRLSFHHTHNAMQLMNDKGAERWVKLMNETLNDPSLDLTDDPRVKPAIATFLTFFLGKYADEFDFDTRGDFGQCNPVLKRKINFLHMTSDQVEALSESELTEALVARGVDTSLLRTKSDMVNKALSL